MALTPAASAGPSLTFDVDEKVDDMAGVAVTAAMNRGDRKAALTAVERISDPQQREAILKRYSFFKQLAEVRSDTASIAMLRKACTRAAFHHLHKVAVSSLAQSAMRQRECTDWR